MLREHPTQYQIILTSAELLQTAKLHNVSVQGGTLEVCQQNMPPEGHLDISHTVASPQFATSQHSNAPLQGMFNLAGHVRR